MYHVTRLKGRGIAIEREDGEAGKADVDLEDGMRAVVATCYGDTAGLKEDIGGVQGGEAGGVG